MTATETHIPARAERPVGLPAPSRAADGRPGVPLPRLVTVELRKMIDTKAGLWLLLIMSAVSAIVVTVFLIWGPAVEATFGTLLTLASFPLLVLLPILGIMSATSEWSQRTGLVTFTLEPRRGRAITAKVIASLILGLVVTASGFAAAAIANVIGASTSDASGAWDVTWQTALGVTLAFAIFVLQGLAFGFLFLNTPFAIVASLVLPTVWSIASGLVSSIETASRWLDLNQVTEPLLNGTMTGENWGQLGTSFGVWVLLPLAVGSWRVLHREVK
ncbi:ABC transporter permease [Knoellia aerolata]|uniref:Uncharacterized protein n=1 Tax=Knoellia aerolata DSM 18566 TaxID=1385519 RepID=A0A0A0JVG0_9MICO|nr:ABC transporter permease [Knoellia aerolata]KGN40017.1 hypothetical protein N801_16810 [Knoellia aerolata DSM 18566]